MSFVLTGADDLSVDAGLVPEESGSFFMGGGSGSGESLLQGGFGEEPPPVVAGRVWRDADADKRRDAGEAGLAGVWVSLYTAAGVLVGSVRTGGNGNYQFQIANPTGQYYLRFGTVPHFHFAPADQGAEEKTNHESTKVRKARKSQELG